MLCDGDVVMYVCFSVSDVSGVSDCQKRVETKICKIQSLPLRALDDVYEEMSAESRLNEVFSEDIERY